MFSLILEDLELFLIGNINSGLTIDDITLILILFADDMVILENSPDHLQTSLNMLDIYCSEGLSENVNKTKIMFFRERVGLRANENDLLKINT